jgi:uncharacterized protein YbbC (DUF1343 family)
MVELGIESFVADSEKLAPAGSRAAFLTHQAAVDGRGVTSLERVRRARPDLVTAVWSPQHGFYGDRQANMIASEDFSDPLSGLPVFSLYGEKRKPAPELLADIDLVLVDLVDVGCRVYTYIWTLFLVLEAAAAAGVRVVVCDRPNPVGGRLVEGPPQRNDHLSFVGLFPIAMRHGLTIGEIALYLKKFAGLDVELEVVAMTGWRRAMDFAATGLFWVLPSPNMPTPATALVYPGQVLLEGCNLSEGRGTTLPFELCGAPFIDPRALLARIEKEAAAGAVLRPTWFTPTFDKWQGELCGGFQLHVVEAESFRPVCFTLALLRAVLELYPKEFAWLAPPYEYEYEKPPIDILTGDSAIRQALAAGRPAQEIAALGADRLATFTSRRETVLLYD